jgi:sugar/nucleoside kinase (ribokinase family)
LIEAMFDVVCFGEILCDMYARARAHGPISRDFTRHLGGESANVATALARLGVRCAVVGAVGDDPLGRSLVEDLTRDGVDVRFVRRLPARTGLTMVVLGARGRRRFLPYRAGSADGAFRREHVPLAASASRWIVLGTGSLVTPGLARATRRLLDLADRRGAHVALDLNARPHLWRDRESLRRAAAALGERAALVKASRDDLLALGGTARRGWLERHAPRASWLLTRGPGVASAIGEHGEVALRPPRARCVDAIGAGDAFLAGSLAALLAAGAFPGSSAWRDPAVWRQALRVGHILGKKAVSRPGAVAGLVRLGRARAVLESVRKEHRP